MLLILFNFVLVNRVQCANILVVTVFPSFSHHVVFQPQWRELSLRHQVTVVTPFPLNDSTLTNLTEIDVSFVNNVWKDNKLEDIMSKNLNDFEKLSSAFDFVGFITEVELKSTQFQKLIRSENAKFDLILIECHFPAFYALAKRFEAPMACLSSLGGITSLHEAIGNPNHPVLYPDFLLYDHSTKISLWKKIKNFFFGLWVLYYHYHILIPRDDILAKKYFGSDVPYIGELEKKMSMVYFDVNVVMHPIRPNVPAVLEMNQVHLQPMKALPKDLEEILDQAPEGVIYFSLGTNVKSVNLDANLRNIIINALSKLPYKVIWKWESDHLPGKPSNVIIRKWVPQQDLLAHPNIRAFVTQGGLQSTEEAISRGVPLIGLPFLADQFMNIQRIVDLEIGLGLDVSRITEEELVTTITEVAGNSLYKQRIKNIQNILQDYPWKGLDKVVWWSEYIIRHKGGKHMRSSGADMSWFEYLMLDIFLIFILTVTAAAFGSYFMLKLISK